MATLSVNGVPYLELEGRVVVGLDGGKPAGGWSPSVCCFCMVTVAESDRGDVES